MFSTFCLQYLLSRSASDFDVRVGFNSDIVTLAGRFSKFPCAKLNLRRASVVMLCVCFCLVFGDLELSDNAQWFRASLDPTYAARE